MCWVAKSGGSDAITKTRSIPLEGKQPERDRHRTKLGLTAIRFMRLFFFLLPNVTVQFVCNIVKCYCMKLVRNGSRFQRGIFGYMYY